MLVKNKLPPFSGLRLDGGELCLDFTNTIHDRTAEEKDDNLSNFTDFVRWLEYCGRISREQSKVLQDKGSAHPETAERIFRKAIRLREAIFNVFASLSTRNAPNTGDLHFMNNCIGHALQARELSLQKATFTIRWKDDSSLETAVGMIAESAFNLALSDHIASVKLCPRCHWLFLDKSKNQRRRWCSMETCGSNEKALNYYYRTQRKSVRRRI